MKSVFFLVGLALAGYAGYLVEPALRITLTGKPHKNQILASEKISDSTPQIDFSTITPEQLPAEVTLLSDVGFSDEATGLRMTLESGAKAKLVRLVNDLVIIRIGTTEYITSVPISQTDLTQRLLNPTPSAEPAAQPETPTATPAITAATEPPAPDPTSQPDPSFPGSEPTPAPDSTPPPETTPPPAPAPEPTPEPAPTPAAQPSASVDVVAIMRQSIEKAEIKEFTANQVKSWKAEPQETLEGSTYDVGTVTYEQETIFGLKTITAKAYISSGKVDRWIWPKSGLTIQ